MITNSPLSDIGMAISPVGTLQDFGLQSADSEVEVEMKPPARERKLRSRGTDFSRKAF